jgi:hypothetical protein
LNELPGLLDPIIPADEVAVLADWQAVLSAGDND